MTPGMPRDHVAAAKRLRHVNVVRARRRRHQALAFIAREIADGAHRMELTPIAASGLHTPTAAFLIGVHAWRDGHGDNVFSATDEPALADAWQAGFAAARAIDIAAGKRGQMALHLSADRRIAAE